MPPKGIEIRGDSIRIRFTYKGKRCAETLRLKPTKRNEAYATRLRESVLHKIETGTFNYAEFFPDSPNAVLSDPGAGHKLGHLLDAWLKNKKNEVEASTWDDYRKTVDGILKPQFGDLRLNKLTKQMVRSWINSLDVSLKRMNNLLIPLRGVIAEALDEDLIKKSPLDGIAIKQKGSTYKKEVIDPFSPAEQANIYSKANPQESNFCQFNFWTGLRCPSEIIALAYEDIDWDRRVVRVRRAYVKKIWKGPKTGAGNREVKLLGAAWEALQAQREFTEMLPPINIVIDGHKESIRLIFMNPKTGNPWDSEGQVRKTMWTPLLKRARVRYRYPYQMRHTYASMMLSAHENPLWVAKQMGHKDWSQIIITYGKWIDDVDPEAGNRAERMIGMAHTRPKGIASG